MNAGAGKTPEIVSQQVYSDIQQGDPTAFLLWHIMPGIAKDRDPGRVLLLHSISYYVSRMGMSVSRWEDNTFANQEYVSYGTAPFAVWGPTYLHLAPASNVPSATAIDTPLAGNPRINLLGP